MSYCPWVPFEVQKHQYMPCKLIKPPKYDKNIEKRQTEKPRKSHKQKPQPIPNTRRKKKSDTG